MLNGSDSFEFIRNYFNRVNTSDPLNRQLYVDIKSYLVDDILVKVDRMSMAASAKSKYPLRPRISSFKSASAASIEM